MGLGMMKELLNGGVWNKTSQLIQDKYGKKIEFRFLTVLESEQPFYSKGDDLVVPLMSRSKSTKSHLGDVVIQRGATMTVDEKMELSDLIQFLIEPQAYNLHLKNVQSTISNQPSKDFRINADSKSNVISIFGKYESPETHATLDDVENSEQKKTISNILHLKSKNTEVRHKIALQIHDISGSSFFVRIQDISKSVRTVNDLKNLAGSTIYVDDILKLNSSEIELISNYAKDQQQIELQFLIGSDLNDKEISTLPCDDQLKKDLMGFMFEIDKVPLSQQIQREVLELLFFSFEQANS
jgi:hypothetical protein